VYHHLEVGATLVEERISGEGWRLSAISFKGKGGQRSLIARFVVGAAEGMSIGKERSLTRLVYLRAKTS